MNPTPHEIYLEACRHGLRLEPAADGGLAIRPKGKCPEDFKSVLRQHKDAMIRWLNSPRAGGWGQVPPSLPLNPVRPELQPAHARLVMEYVVRQIPGVCPLCEWCLKRELDCWNSFGWSHEDCALAAARDCALWQQGASTDSELIARLEASEDLANTPPHLDTAPPRDGTAAQWLAIARQVLAGEFDKADLSTIQSLITGLRANPHSTAREALEKLRPLEALGIERMKAEEARRRKRLR